MDDHNRSVNFTRILDKINTLAQNGPSQPAGFNSYVDKLIEDKGFPDITTEVREEIKKDVLRRLNDFIAARIIAGLSDADVNTFEQMLKDGKPDTEIQNFVTTHIANFVDFLTNVLLEFRGVYLGTIQSPEFIQVGTTNVEQKTPSKPPPAPVTPAANQDLKKLN